MEMDISKSSLSSGDSARGFSLPNIIQHHFTRDQFMKKFKLILAPNVGSQEVEEAWTGYLESIIEPCDWLAVWIPSLKTAEHYECVAGDDGACVVEVHHVDARSFMADIELLQTPATLQIEDKTISVDVAELFPLANQAQNDTLLIEETAEALALYRCFYKRIWRPWDGDENITDWADKHLQSRVDFMMDHTTKSGNYSMAKRLHELADEAQKTKDEISELEETAVDVDDSQLDDIHMQLQQLAVRAHEITHEAKLLDDPVYGQLNYSALQAEKVVRRKADRVNLTPGIILVWKNGCNSVKEMINTMENIENQFGELKVHIVSSLEHAMDIAEPDDIIVLAQAVNHHITNLQSIARGGKIIGLDTDGSKKKPVLVASQAAQCLLQLQGNVELDSIVLDLCGLVKTGFILEQNATLTMNNVHIKKCEVGVEQRRGSVLELTDVTLEHCNTALLTNKQSSTHKHNVVIRNCGTDYEYTEEKDDQPKNDDSVFELRTVDICSSKEKKVMREDFEKLSRLHRVSSSTPKSEVNPLEMGRLESLGYRLSQESSSTALASQTSIESFDTFGRSTGLDSQEDTDDDTNNQYI
jgi:hypothetical protein